MSFTLLGKRSAPPPDFVCKNRNIVPPTASPTITGDAAATPRSVNTPLAI